MKMLAGIFWIANTISNASRYADGLLATQGRKTCTEIGRITNWGHDAVQRDLDKVAKNPEQVRNELQRNVIDLVRKTPGKGALITDNTLLHKQHSKRMQGVSYQYSSSSKHSVPGIGITAIVWTDMDKNVVPVDLFAWQKGDKSKIQTATDLTISIAQQIGTQTTLADSSFASIDALKAYCDASMYTVMRFNSNRAVSLSPNEKPVQLRHQECFKFSRNQRAIVKEVFWHGLRLSVIALKVPHKKKGSRTIFLVTNAPFKMALKYAKFYKHRWKIEVFFRDAKQTYGLGQCQARTLKKQEAHCLGVFLAYIKSFSQKSVLLAAPKPPTKKMFRHKLRPMQRKKLLPRAEIC